MNTKGFYTREEIEKTGKPFLAAIKWRKLKVKTRKVYLTKSRAKKLGFPIGEKDEIVAYRYTTKGPGPAKYIRLYDRSFANIDENELYPKEIVDPKKIEIAKD